MEKHNGHLVEKILRKNGYNISELARLLNVNRRSVYNWFYQKKLKAEIIYKIGVALNYNFSIDFPELFSSNEFENTKAQISAYDNAGSDQFNETLWKDKYISLLEDYNDMLTKGYPNQEKQSSK